MTEEQITAIAREYAEEYYNVRVGTELMADEAENVIRFVLQRYCLVEKSKMEELDIPRRAREHKALILDKRELDAIFSGVAELTEEG